MSSPLRFKLVFFSPTNVTQKILSHLFAIPGVAKTGEYDSCAFVSRGVGQFRPLENANPTIGQVGQYEFVEEDRVEFAVSVSTKEELMHIVTELKKVHPYEEPGYDVYKLEDF